jgi:hypothetical protein
MKKKGKTVGENDVFVTLIRVAQEDADVKRTLMGLLQQPSFHRRSLLNTLIDTMKLQGAPTAFVAAVAALLDDKVAEKAAEMIKG